MGRNPREEGRVGGRPRVAPRIEALVRAARAEKKGIRKIAREIGVGVSVVQRIVAA